MQTDIATCNTTYEEKFHGTIKSYNISIWPSQEGSSSLPKEGEAESYNLKDKEELIRRGKGNRILGQKTGSCLPFEKSTTTAWWVKNWR